MNSPDCRQSAGQYIDLSGHTAEVAAENLACVLHVLFGGTADSDDIQARRLPPPHVLRVLLALMRYRSHVTLSSNVCSNRMATFVDLPGTDWQYGGDSHLCLRNCVTGEEISLSGSHLFDELYTGDFLAECSSPSESSSIFQLASEPFPAIDVMRVALRYLEEYGLCYLKDDDSVMESDSATIRLSSLLIVFQGIFDSFLDHWDQADTSTRVKLAKISGDWLYVDSIAPTDESRRCAEECRDKWVDCLHGDAAGAFRQETILALAHAGELEEHLERAFSCELTAVTALEFVRDDPRWCDRVWKLLQHAMINHSALVEYLVRHRYKVPAVLSNMAARDWGSGTAIELALDSAPQLIPQLLRKGIRRERWSPGRCRRVGAHRSSVVSGGIGRLAS